MIDPRYIWNVIYIARSNRSHRPESPNIAPAMQNDFHDWSSLHMKRHLRCVEQQKSPFGVRLPRKMTFMIDPRHIWNVIYNARSNSCHPPTSPNIAPACCHANDSHAWSSSHMKRRLQCAEQQMPPSNLTKSCACHAKWPPKIWQKFAENSWNVIYNARPSETVPSMIREWNRSATRRATEVTFRARHIEKYNISRSGYLSKFTNYCYTKHCACHEKWHLSFTKYCPCHEKSHLNFTKNRACHKKWHLSFTKYCACHEKWHLNFTKYCACHERWSISFTTWRLLLLDDSYYLTLLFDDSYYPTLPLDDSYYLTLLLFDNSYYILDSTITWLYFYLTTPTTWRFLLLDSSITWRLVLLDDSYSLTIPITWWSLLFNDPSYLTTPITWLYYCLTLLLLDDCYYLTTPSTGRFLLLDGSYYSTIPITWRFLLLDCAMSFVVSHQPKLP